MRTLLVATGVYTLDQAAATVRCLVVDGDRVAWAGVDPADAPPSDRQVDLGRSWITPAFVDAHVHATATGLSLAGVPIADATSAEDLCERLRRHAEAHPDRAVLMGAGWDNFAWPGGRRPTAVELQAAAPGRTVLLLRTDAHSCLVDAGTLARLPLERLDGVDRDAEGNATGWLREAASEAAQDAVRQLLSAQQLHEARVAACRSAAGLGIGSIHEMGHPGLSGLDDARAWRDGDWPIDVQVWWAQLDLGVALAERLRPGGDLFLDGSIGSGTAATTRRYGPDGSNGQLFHDNDAVGEWFTACTIAGHGAGVHAIGDRAIEQALTALEAAAATAGVDAVRRCRHRIEHVEMPTSDHVKRLASLDIVASVQPVFDATWGGDHGLYAERFGIEVARSSNPFAHFAKAGVRMAFGSDSTVTPLDPWGGVVAAERHLGGLGLSRRDALVAHTLGGRYIAGQDDVGRLAPGWRADLAVWDDDPFAVDDVRQVRCLATTVAGSTVHGTI